MQAQDVTQCSIAQLAELIRRRELSPVEVATQYLRRIEQINPRINAYVTVTADRAMEDARRGGDRHGNVSRPAARRAHRAQGQR